MDGFRGYSDQDWSDRTEVVGVDDQQIRAEGTLGKTDDAGFRRRYGTKYVLLDESKGGDKGELVNALRSH